MATGLLNCRPNKLPPGCTAEKRFAVDTANPGRLNALAVFAFCAEMTRLSAIDLLALALKTQPPSPHHPCRRWSPTCGNQILHFPLSPSSGNRLNFFRNPVTYKDIIRSPTYLVKGFQTPHRISTAVSKKFCSHDAVACPSSTSWKLPPFPVISGA